MLVLLERPKIDDLCLLRRVKWSPNGNHIAAILFKRIRGEPISTVLLWDLASSADPKVLGNFQGRILSIGFAGDGQFLAAGIDAQTVRVWDLDNGNSTFDFPEEYAPKARRNNDYFQFPAFAQIAGDGGDLIFAYCETNWCSAALSDSKVLRKLAKDDKKFSVESCASTPDGTKLVLAGRRINRKNYVRIFTIVDDKISRETTLYAGYESCERIFVSRCGTRFGFAMERDLQIASTDTAKRDRITLRGHESFVYAATFGPDSDTVITGGQDGTTRVWNIARGVETAKYDWEIGRVTALDLSPDGGAVAAGGDGEHALVIWDLD